MWKYYKLSSSVRIDKTIFMASIFGFLVIILIQIFDELVMKSMILVMKVEIGKSNLFELKILFKSFRRKNRSRRYIEHLTSSDSDPDDVSCINIEYRL